MANETTKQVTVIGGGPGGYAAAFKAADLGLDVTLIEKEKNPGGVCLYRGCIPSKALLHVGKLLHETKEAENWGLSFGEPKLDLDKLRSWKESVVAKLTGGLGQLCKARKINYIRGEATFVDQHTVSVKLTDGSTEEHTFENAIIATGSSPTVIPAFDIGSDRIIDSTGALDIPDIPETMLVVGGGYIGLEMGSVYAELGTEVTVVEMMDGILPSADRDLAAVLEKQLRKRFEDILLNTAVESMKEVDGGIEVMLKGENDDKAKPRVFEKVLICVGRRPNSGVLGLENAGVETGLRGFINIDKQCRTNVDHIFAIGDIAGEPMLAHKASHEGLVAAEVIAGEKVAFQAQAIPGVVFTDPELAWAGLTEQEALAQEIDVKVGKFPWGASGRATAIERPDGLTKLIMEPDTGRILGIGIVGAGAGEMIAEGVLAIEMAANATDLKLSVHAHPTLSETIMEAAELFTGSATHIMRPKTK